MFVHMGGGSWRISSHDLEGSDRKSTRPGVVGPLPKWPDFVGLLNGGETNYTY